MIKIIQKILILSLFPVYSLFCQQLIDGIAATVGNEIILRSEIDQHVQNYVIQNRIDVKKQPQIISQLKEQTLERLVEQKLLLAKAEEDTLKVEDEILDKQVDQRMRYLIERVGSEDKLEQLFGNSIKKIRRDTRDIVKEQLLVEKARAEKFRNVKVSRREVEEFYHTYKDSLPTMQETVKIAHILKLVKASDDAQMTAKQKMQGILDQIKAGADFAELAEKYSEDPASSRRGGDLGMISRGDFVTEFEAVAFGLKDGELSDIVQTQFGFHIIKMIERRGEKVRTRHILIQVAPTQEDEKHIIEQLNEIHQRAIDGEDFSDLAMEYSEDENVTDDKGELGVFETDKLVVPQFKEIIKDLNVGEISQPFKTEFGYHIVLLQDRQESRKLTLKDNWQQIEQMALNFKMEKEYRVWISELKEYVAIEIRE